MHIRISNAITKSRKVFDVKKVLANRPKGLSDTEWNEIVADAKLNKLILIGQAPKEVRRKTASAE